MIAHFLKDPWTYLCTAMIAATQWVMENIGTMAGIVMFLGSVMTLLFRYRADRRKEKHAKEIQSIELEIKRQELENIKNKNTHI